MIGKKSLLTIGEVTLNCLHHNRTLQKEPVPLVVTMQQTAVSVYTRYRPILKFRNWYLEGQHGVCDRVWYGPSLLKNWCRMPMRSPSVRPRSATTPSIWWNSARWVASRVSLRNTRSMEKYFTGLNSSWGGEGRGGGRGRRGGRRRGRGERGRGGRREKEGGEREEGKGGRDL